jgi:hypothetical protein
MHVRPTSLRRLGLGRGRAGRRARPPPPRRGRAARPRPAAPRPRRIEDLGPRAVVEGDVEGHARVGRVVAFGALHRLTDPRLEPLATSQEQHARAPLLHLGHLGGDLLEEEIHERAHLVVRPRPVLGRERVDGELGDLAVERAFDDVAQGLGAGAVPDRCRQMAP